MFICKECGKEFKSLYGLNGHIGAVHSKKYKENQAIKKEGFRKKYTSNPKHCKYCGKLLSFGQRYNTFCGHKCAATYNNIARGGTENKNKKGQLVLCEYCGKSFTVRKNTSGKYCSRHCSHEGMKEESIKNWLSGNAFWKYSLPGSIKEYIYNRQDNKCAICGIGRIWNNEPMNFVFDHINGDSTNNSENNLRAICSNCDSQLETYKGRNKNSGRFYRKERYRRGESY